MAGSTLSYDSGRYFDLVTMVKMKIPSGDSVGGGCNWLCLIQLLPKNLSTMRKEATRR